MPAEPAAIELLERPDVGRVVERARKVRLGDVDRVGRLRLDATARYLQDIATDDADDAGLDRRFGWLVRRTLVRLDQPATLGEQLQLATWCTGIGRSWAERRTELRGDKGAAIDTVSLWVQIDVTTGRPATIGDDFTAAYAEACDGRRVSARLALGAGPDDDSTERPWTVRSIDLDPFDHVNNAATWAIAEDAFDLGERRGIAELEYPQPINADADHRLAVHGDQCWLIENGTVAAVSRWTPAN
ncbi:MAG: acyl-ACP thioesterase domain-containing protein [Actinomycetota bacterium]